MIIQTLQVLERRLSLKIEDNAQGWVKDMLTGNHRRLDIVGRSNLKFKILSCGGVRRRGQNVLPRISMVHKVGAVLEGADIDPIVFEIDSRRGTKRGMGSVKIDRR